MSTRLTNTFSHTQGDKCSRELFYGKKPDIYKHFVKFGHVGYMKLGKKQNKLEPKAVKCVMIGYSPNHAGDTYRLYNTETKSGKQLQYTVDRLAWNYKTYRWYD